MHRARACSHALRRECVPWAVQQVRSPVGLLGYPRYDRFRFCPSHERIFRMFFSAPFSWCAPFFSADEFRLDALRRRRETANFSSRRVSPHRVTRKRGVCASAEARRFRSFRIFFAETLPVELERAQLRRSHRSDPHLTSCLRAPGRAGRCEEGRELRDGTEACAGDRSKDDPSERHA